MDSARLSSAPIVNDFGGFSPVAVWAVVVPESVEALVAAISRSDGPISVDGGRFSMGGQLASAGSLHLDLRALNQVVSFSPLHRTIRV